MSVEDRFKHSKCVDIIWAIIALIILILQIVYAAIVQTQNDHKNGWNFATQDYPEAAKWLGIMIGLSVSMCCDHSFTHHPAMSKHARSCREMQKFLVWCSKCVHAMRETKGGSTKGNHVWSAHVEHPIGPLGKAICSPCTRL